jgi:hypothetical protein
MRRYPKGITAIVDYPTLPGGTPARVEMNTGVMERNMSVFNRIPESHQMFIMLHEMAHVVLQTTNEIEADAWAFKQYADMGYPLSESVKALTRILNPNLREHNERMYLQTVRAEKYDREINHNTKV